MQFPELASGNKVFIFEEGEKRKRQKFSVYSTFFTFVCIHSVASTAASPLAPWNFPGKNAGVNCHFLLQGSNWCLLGHLHWKVGSLPLAYPGKPLVYPYLFIYLTLRSFNVYVNP